MSKYDDKKKELSKKGSFSFLTRKGFRVDASGHTPSEAYKVARSVTKHHGKNLNRYPKDNSYRKATEGDKLNGTYFRYRNGIHANDGKYSQIRKSGFKKHNDH